MKSTASGQYTGSVSRRLAAAVLTGGVLPATRANLISNASFEPVPGTGAAFQSLGLMPSDWVSVNQTPDTYSNGGSFGLRPDTWGVQALASRERPTKVKIAWPP
jgi:hypothetical protein